jgi:hypothetical protein
MRRSARTALCGGCRAIGIPTATARFSEYKHPDNKLTAPRSGNWRELAAFGDFVVLSWNTGQVLSWRLMEGVSASFVVFLPFLWLTPRVS